MFAWAASQSDSRASSPWIPLANKSPDVHILPIPMQRCKDMMIEVVSATGVCECPVLPVGDSASPLTPVAAVTALLGLPTGFN